jgi:hypothetical protein
MPGVGICRPGLRTHVVTGRWVSGLGLGAHIVTSVWIDGLRGRAHVMACVRISRRRGGRGRLGRRRLMLVVLGSRRARRQ